MYLSCCVWALTAPENRVLSDMRALGFRCIDIRPDFLQTPASQAHARSQSLKVSSVAASYGMPNNAALDSSDQAQRDGALSHVEQAVTHCATLGGSAVYLVPGADNSAEALACYAD